MPLALEIGAEIRRKVGGSGVLTFTRLQAADVQGRARGAKALHDAGVAVDRALALAGF